MPILILESQRRSKEAIMRERSYSVRRVSAIMKVLISLNLVEKQDEIYKLTDNGKNIFDWIRQNRWSLIHDYLEANHGGFSVLNKVIIKGTQRETGEGVPKTRLKDYELELIEEGRTTKPLLTNYVVIDFLLDWGERLGKIVENKLSDASKWYLLNTDQPSPENYHLLKSTYLKLAGTGLGRRPYISIPLFREFSCEILKISRSLFDYMLITLFQEKPRTIHLTGAPEATLSIKGVRPIKSISYSANNMLELESSPLYGLKVINREFYYINLEVDEI